MQTKNIIRKILIIIGIIALYLILVPMKNVNAATNYYITLGDGSFATSKKLGDINLDGIYTNRDLNLLVENIENTNALEGIINADINSDYVINKEDYVYDETTQKYLPAIKIYNEFAVGTVFSLKLTKQAEYKNEDYNISNVLWQSSNTNIATVNEQTGKVTITGEGSGSIIAKVNGNEVDKVDFYALSEENLKEIKHTIMPYMGADISTTLTYDESIGLITLTIHDDSDLSGVNAEFILDSSYGDIKLNSVFRPHNNQEIMVWTSSENWEITAKTHLNGRLRIIAEIKDELLNNSDFDKVLKIYIGLGKNSISRFGYSEIILDKLITTDNISYGNERDYLKYYDATNKPFGILAKKIDKLEATPAITVKSGCEQKVKIIGNTMYVKLDGKEKENLKVEDLANCLNIKDELNMIFVLRSSVTHATMPTYTNEKNGTLYGVMGIGWYGGNNIPDFYSTDQKSDYYSFMKVVILGDVCYDDDCDINIKDVILLRNLIVKKPYTEQGFICQPEAGDVNNWTTYGDVTRTEPNIGDVIAIRQRILNNKWIMP